MPSALPDATHPTLLLGAKFGTDACSAPMTGPRVQATHRRLAKVPPASTCLFFTVFDANLDIAILLYPAANRLPVVQSSPLRGVSAAGTAPSEADVEALRV